MKPLIDIGKDPGYNAPLVPTLATTHSISLATTRLSIGKYGSIIAQQAIINDRLRNSLKDLILGLIILKNLLEIVLLVLFYV
jgi:hypothetical protein